MMERQVGFVSRFLLPPSFFFMRSLDGLRPVRRQKKNESGFSEIEVDLHGDENDVYIGISVFFNSCFFRLLLFYSRLMSLAGLLL